MSELITYAICGIVTIVCFAMWLIPEPYYGYKKELLLLDIEIEKTKRESIKLAQKMADKDKEAEKTKQLQIKADYEKKYKKTLCDGEN